MSRYAPEPVRVVFSADENYVIPLAAAVRSAIDNLGPGSRLDVVVLSRGIPAQLRDRLVRSWGEPAADVNFIDVSEDAFRDLPAPGYFSPSIWTRLLIAELLPRSWDRVIYLDADVLVLADLRELWNSDIGEHPLAATQDAFIRYVSDDKGVLNWQQVGLDPRARYLNSGVLLVDVNRWRRREIGRASLEYASTHSKIIRMPDQEALNVALNGDWTPLDPTWNVGTFYYETQERIRRYHDLVSAVKIRHFTTYAKPWIHEYRSVAGADLFYAFLDRTAWRGWRPPAR